MKNKRILALIAFFTGIPFAVYGMHIAEGFLPPLWALLYYVVCIPFAFIGLKKVKELSKEGTDIKMLLGLVAAYCLLLSALKLPSLTGSSSHLTGVSIGTIIFGPMVMSVVAIVVLIFQALFLAHGGITTLGANTFSMGIVGPLVTFAIYQMFRKNNKQLGMFLGALIGNFATYAVTALQLAVVFHDGNFTATLGKFLSVFAITQVPLGIVEGIFTVLLFDYLTKSSNETVGKVIGGYLHEK